MFQVLEHTSDTSDCRSVCAFALCRTCWSPPHDMSCHAMSWPCHAMSCLMKTGNHVMAVSCHVVPCHMITRNQVMLCHVPWKQETTTCHAMSRHMKTGKPCHVWPCHVTWQRETSWKPCKSKKHSELPTRKTLQTSPVKATASKWSSTWHVCMSCPVQPQPLDGPRRGRRTLK